MPCRISVQELFNTLRLTQRGRGLCDQRRYLVFTKAFLTYARGVHSLTGCLSRPCMSASGGRLASAADWSLPGPPLLARCETRRHPVQPIAAGGGARRHVHQLVERVNTRLLIKKIVVNFDEALLMSQL